MGFAQGIKKYLTKGLKTNIDIVSTELQSEYRPPVQFAELSTIALYSATSVEKAAVLGDLAMFWKPAVIIMVYLPTSCTQLELFRIINESLIDGIVTRELLLTLGNGESVTIVQV